jgi:hypothetical protein
MITSAPFDNWWHNAYALDVTILSPPHVLLMSGSIAIDIGTLILIGGSMNRCQGDSRAKFRRLFLYVGGIIVMHGYFLITEYTGSQALHGATAYLAVSLAVPLAMVGVSRASEHRWGNTIVVAVYTAAVLAQLWILPLFAAQPKLGPVYQNVTHFIPMAFPLLLIVPGLALDLESYHDMETMVRDCVDWHRVLDRHDPCFDRCDAHHAPGVHLGQLDKTGSKIKGPVS